MSPQAVAVTAASATTSRVTLRRTRPVPPRVIVPSIRGAPGRWPPPRRVMRGESPGVLLRVIARSTTSGGRDMTTADGVGSFVDEVWERDVMPTLLEYIAIPNVS